MFSARPVKFLHRDSQTSHLLIHTLHTVHLITKSLWETRGHFPLLFALLKVEIGHGKIETRQSWWLQSYNEIDIFIFSHKSPLDIRGLSWCIQRCRSNNPQCTSLLFLINLSMSQSREPDLLLTGSPSVFLSLYQLGLHGYIKSCRGVWLVAGLCFWVKVYWCLWLHMACVTVKSRSDALRHIASDTRPPPTSAVWQSKVNRHVSRQCKLFDSLQKVSLEIFIIYVFSWNFQD